ncbi:MAG: sugar ABC transporter permease [Deltaproteobacteria bacterium]|nr:sugar ABC transporter permease [Deltaproteobacteria bacterium]
MSLENSSPISKTASDLKDLSPAIPSPTFYQKIVEMVPWYVWWLFPAVIILATITIFPFFWMIYMSFMKIQLQPGMGNLFVGLANWIKMFENPNISHGWMLLAIYILACMVLQMGLGLGIALLINNMKGESFFSTVFLIPMMVAPVVVGHLFNLLLNSSYGLYAWILNTLGLYSAGSLLSNPKTALWAIVAMDTWEWTPLIILIVSAGLKSVPRETIEAAHVDGSSPLQVFFQVTLPYIKPALVIAFLLRFMDCMRFIDLILITTRGGPAVATKTLPFYLYTKTFQEFDIGVGAVMGFTLLVIIIICAMLTTTILLKEPETERV